MGQSGVGGRDGFAGAGTAVGSGQSADATDDSEAQPERVARREAMKKAAAAAAAAGAVWAAPKVEGLSLVPDYAAAGTATGIDIRMTIGAGEIGNDTNLQNIGSACNPIGEPRSWLITSGNPSANDPSPVTPFSRRTGPDNDDLVTWTNNNDVRVSAPGNGSHYSRDPAPSGQASGTNWNSEPGVMRGAESGNNFTLAAPLGVAGNVSVNTDDTEVNLTNGARVWDVTFNVDPPFNKCRVTEATLYRCSEDTNTSNASLNTWNDAGDNVHTTTENSPSPEVTIANPGYTPSGNPGASWTSTVTLNSPGNPAPPGSVSSPKYLARAVSIRIQCT